MQTIEPKFLWMDSAPEGARWVSGWSAKRFREAIIDSVRKTRPDCLAGQDR